MLSITTAHLTAKFDCFAAFVRNNTPNKPLPFVEIEFQMGAKPKLEATFVPVEANRFVGYVHNGFAHERLRADRVHDRAFLPELKGPLEKLKNASAPFGDPRPHLLRAFEEGSVELLNERFQRACWWLAHGLSGEAFQSYVAEYREVQQALGFMQPLGIVIPDPNGAVPEDWETPNLIGRKLSEFLEHHRGAFLQALQLLTNNADATLSWAPYPVEQTDIWGEWLRLWQTHYGKMWGPFER